MRLSGTRELVKLYEDLGAVGYIASLSSLDLIRMMKEDRKYIANMRADLDIKNDGITFVLYDRYPEEYQVIVFIKRGERVCQGE